MRVIASLVRSSCAALLLAVVCQVTWAQQAAPGRIEPSKVALQVEGQAVQAWLFRMPETGAAGVTTRLPAVVALHGCGGLYSSAKSAAPFTFNARHEDYAQMLAKAGYLVLFVDSFGSRGVESICSDKDRKIRPHIERVKDAAAALAYLAALPQVDPKRIGLLGWSNGGSTVLHTMHQQSTAGNLFAAAGSQRFSAAVSFYPGCSGLQQRGNWRSSTPLKLMLGGKDNWTPAAPCEALASQAQAQGLPVSMELYPEAVHDFDAPNSRMRERTGLAFTADGSGRAWVGTHEPSRQAAQASLRSFFATFLVAR
jgi:dienelactone hydrolase